MYYAFQDRDTLYLVMDLLNGGDLRYHICQHKRFDEETTSKFHFIFLLLTLFIIEFFVACLVAGLEYCHEKKILHRDIKPGNVLLMVEGDRMRPLVTDFGIAKVAEVGANFTKVGSAMGTPGFSAPEQVLDAADVDARADIFSLVWCSTAC